MISTKENNLSGGVESSVATQKTRHLGKKSSERTAPRQEVERPRDDSGSSAPPTQSFSSLNKNDRFTNRTGATFEKLGNHTARIVKYPGKPWMVGTFYTFGAFNYVEKI